ncbi:MAG: NAD-dependent epimerase/dehydratase [Candidatus Parvarchaeum acidiphilum ARMAN-4]|uniref:NAD-dependent epimerase/dehydratase n=1 Tax=Candidatus Parvarchaeum acidiphilum ARMAN-4 TaxID=662760 RepID=D2EF33_PARA4|nr:MAG: NAD-dependent epimerase/dehydratase [Candidatus Parvarchaeum acidiphilum ARMAN-4]
MKLIVTGGYGFIGSNFILYWLKKHRKDEIINVDKLTYAADPDNLKDLSQNAKYTFINGDIADKEFVERTFKDADAIINFAAESHVDNSIKNSSLFISSNIVGVHNILETVRKTGIRFHQISTDEVYGSLSLNSKEKFNENSKYNPRNPYSATKAAADFLVRAYYNTYKLPVTISNCSNNYGINQHPEKLIPKTLLNAYLDESIPVYGNGKQIRDWIFVEDHCSAIELIIQKGVYGETYLIGENGEKRNIDVIRTILKTMKKPDSLIKFVEDRPGHDVRYAIDSRKIQKELKWKPKFAFEKGIKITIEHYLKNKERYLKKMS